jgi:hypothetical protein
MAMKEINNITNFKLEEQSHHKAGRYCAQQTEVGSIKPSTKERNIELRQQDQQV